jgi:hypothetical protein
LPPRFVTGYWAFYTVGQDFEGTKTKSAKPFYKLVSGTDTLLFLLPSLGFK